MANRIRKSGPREIDAKSLVDEYVAREASRRQFMRATMLATVGTWLGARGLAACGPSNAAGGDSGAGGNEAGTSQDSAMPTDSGVNPMPHLVGMGYHETDHAAAVSAALAETVGLSMIRPGDSVYLRVNSNSGDFYPYSTSPDTLQQIGRMLRDLGVTDLRIGDRSFWGDPDTAGNLEANGVAEAARQLGTTAMVFDDSVNWITLPPEMVPNWTGTVRLPEPVTSATHIINVGCVKTHFIARITMSLKLSLGLVNADDRMRAGNLQTHDTSVLHQQIAQINKGFTPTLNILDGYEALVSGGPTMTDRPPNAPATWDGGITASPKVVIVSTDRIAADVTGIAVLQTLSPAYELVTRTRAFANPTIAAAIAAGGLGIESAAAYDLSGPTVPMIDTYRARAIA
jgi:uncharacterized protein (DUF362 family)